MSKSKVYPTAKDALADIHDGATIMVSGFGTAGIPDELIGALIKQGAKDLTLVNNNAGNGDTGIAALLQTGCVRKVICSFPRQEDSWHFDALYRKGAIELELVPQGTLAERIRAAGAGIGAFFVRTSYGTLLAKGKETKNINGIDYVMEYPIVADFALVRAYVGDTMGNVTYRKTARNFGPVMAASAKCTIVQVASLVEPGDIDPENVITPCIYVKRIVHIPS